MDTANPPPSSADWRLAFAGTLSQIGQMIFAVAVAVAIHHQLYASSISPQVIEIAFGAGAFLLIAAGVLGGRYVAMIFSFARAASVGCLAIAVVELWYYLSRNPRHFQDQELPVLIGSLAFFISISVLDHFLKRQRK